MQINSFYINLVSLEDCLGGMYINYIVYLLSLFNYMVLCRVCVKLESMGEICILKVWYLYF